MKRLKIALVIVTAVALAGATGCMPGGGNGEEESGRQLAEVVRDSLTISVNGSGFIETPDEEVLTFNNNGRVGNIYVKNGDNVSRGQCLASLHPLDEEALALAVTRAEASLLQVEYELDQVVNPYTEEEIEEAEEEVDDAEEWLEMTEDMLRYVMKHGGEWEVMEWKMEVFKAETQLDTAEETLENMEEEPDAELVASLEKQVQAAAEALAEAEKDLQIEVINAPFSGVVSRVYVEEGDIIPPSNVSAAPVVRLLDTSTMELVIELDEIDIPGVEVGQRAIISVDALPSLDLEGTVTSIAAVPTVEAGVVLYDAVVSFDIPEGSRLMVGMSASADIVSTERTDVLLVPDRAIKYGEDGAVVYVMVDEEIEERAVVIGISDGFHTEIKEGLEEGEVVVISKSDSDSESDEGFGFFG